jgi:23S rRNA (uracil1939-C5)-methyltransferase
LTSSKEEIHEVVVDRIAAGGAGVARLSTGKACFIRGTAPGERVRAVVTAHHKKFAEARVLEILEPSERRVQAPCPHFGICGGCDYQHLAYPLQLEIKYAHVRDALTRIGKLAGVDISPTLASPAPYGYRNRITVHSVGGRTGFFERGTRRVVDVDHCAIADSATNAALTALRAGSPRDGAYPLRPSGTFRGFRQVNDSAAGILLDVVKSMACGGHLVDAYCGAGFFGHALAAVHETVTGIEWSADAVRKAREDAHSNETYWDGDVAMRLQPVLASLPTDASTVIVDPPAAGLESMVIRALTGPQTPRKLIYVSCDPATLARDLAKLSGAFCIVRVQPVDMFPQTAHIECVAELARF